MIPGPRAPTSRPNRKTTARSYSRRILSPLSTNATTTAIAPHIATHTPGIAAPFSGSRVAQRAVLLDRPLAAGDASCLLQVVEKPGCVCLRHGKQRRDERSIGHRLHGQPVEDGQNGIRSEGG